ncbi:MAG: hypothetical protein LBT99_03615 [Bifidobacteriaceae bacterium]|jgi:hypothetical protein|nr:hypothetical protein [Bifidobacteriaceae bacterium]
MVYLWGFIRMFQLLWKKGKSPEWKELEYLQVLEARQKQKELEERGEVFLLDAFWFYLNDRQKELNKIIDEKYGSLF